MFGTIPHCLCALALLKSLLRLWVNQVVTTARFLACLQCRLFLTLCVIIKRQLDGKHSPSGVQVTGAALTLAELFEDFVTGSHLADVPVDCDGATAMELGLDTKRCTSEVCQRVM